MSRTVPQSAEGGEAWAEHAFANIYADRIEHGIKLADVVDDPAVGPSVKSIDEVAEELSNKRSLPNEVFTSNFYVHPTRLEALAAVFREAPTPVIYMPVSPFANLAYDRTRDIFGIIEQIFIKSGTQRHVYLALLALRWIRGMPLRELVNARLEWEKTIDDATAINKEIRALFKEIEEDLRYRYVKYTGLYLKVLNAILRERGYEKEAEKLLPLNLFLEFGASSQTLISLMSIGLSRTSAIMLKVESSLPDDLDVLTCRTYLQSINLDRIHLPTVCKSEIRRLRGDRVRQPQ